MAALATRTVRKADLVADVLYTSLQDGDIERWDAASRMWKNVPLPASPDLSGYVLQAGRSGGQQVAGGSGSGGNLTLVANNGATAGNLLFLTAAGTEVARFTSTPRFGFGTNNPTQFFHVQASAVSCNAFFDQVGSFNHGFFMQRANGAVGSLTAVVDGNSETFNFRMYDGAAYTNNASIQAVVRGTVASGLIPTDLVFNTQNNPGGTAEKLRITGNGRAGLNLGTGIVPTATLDVINWAQAAAATTTCQMTSKASQTNPVLSLVQVSGGATKNDLLSVTGSGGAQSYRIGYQGFPIFKGTAAIADADLQNNEISLYWDDAASQIHFKVKTASGTIKHATLTAA